MKKFTPFLLIVAALLMLSACQTNSMISDPFSEENMTNEVIVDQPEEKNMEEAMEEPADTAGTSEDAVEAADLQPEDSEAMEEETETPGEDSAADDSIMKEEESVASETPLRSFTMTAKQFEFTPSTITVNEGDEVEITVTSTDVEHGFALPDFGVDVKLPPNESQVIRFTADKKGTFSFRCNVFCGAGHGEMKGTLIVE